MAEHILKTLPVYWDAVNSRQKRFEVRKNDRAFQPGDIVVLRRYDPTRCAFEMRPVRGVEYYDIRFKIGWMLQGGQFGIEPGYCVFQLEEVKE